MGSAEELLELKRRLMAGEINADEYRRAKIAAYQAGAPRSRSDRLVSPSDSGRIQRSDSDHLATRKKRDSIEAKRRLLTREEAQRRRAEDPAAAGIAAQRERMAAKDTRRLQAIQGGRGNPAAAAIETKRRKMAASLARRKEEAEHSPPGLQLVVIVRPRGMRTTARLAREEAERMRQEGLRLADLEAEEAEAKQAAPPPEESADDYIDRRLREARERLRGD